MSRQESLQEPLMGLDESTEEALVREHNEDVLSIVSEMTGLRSLMSNVSAMVGDQGAQLDTTERYVEHADVLVDEGVHELQYASDYQWSARKKLCAIGVCVALVLAVGLVLLIVWLTGGFQGEHPPAPPAPPTTPTSPNEGR